MNLRQASSTFRGHRVPRIDFISRRNRWFALSGVLILLSLVGLFGIGLKFSIDFKGGAVLKFPNASGAPISEYQRVLASFPQTAKDSRVELINVTQIQITTESLTNPVSTPSPSASPSVSPS